MCCLPPLPVFRTEGTTKRLNCSRRSFTQKKLLNCAAGVKWFKYLCSRSKTPTAVSVESIMGNGDEESEEVIGKFHEIVRAYFRGPLKPPFNEVARKAAGFGPQSYEPLAVKDFTR